jgi:hypothetical protein
MGGEGPAVMFSQDATAMASWATRTDLKRLDEEELEACYASAKDFLLQLGNVLVSDHDWHQEPDTDALLLLTSDCTYSGYAYKCRLLLPLSFASFLDALKSKIWDRMFGQRIFVAKRPNNDFFIDSAPPLSDLFYLLQTFLPGMLLVYCIDDMDDVGEIEAVRALPCPAWIKTHKELLETIFGGQRYDTLLKAAASTGYKSETISSYEPDEDDKMKDLTACDQECGYCGHCVYY